MKLQTLCERILNLVCYYESEGRCTFDAVRAEKILDTLRTVVSKNAEAVCKV